MRREEQQARQQKAAQMYKDGVPVPQIQAATGYTQTMIYTILKQNGIPSHRAITASHDPDVDRLRPGLCKLVRTAQNALSRADLLEGRPNMVLTDEEFKKMSVSVKRRNDVAKELQKLGLCIMTAPYPAIYDLKNNRYYRITHRELLFLYANPMVFLKENANDIKRGWKAKYALNP